jgi:hypothetical protein
MAGAAIGKWILILSLLGLTLSYLVALLYSGMMIVLSQTFCALPFVGHKIPICVSISRAAGAPTLDPTVVVDVQKQLEAAMGDAGEGFSLARDMVGHEFSLRDLRIRVMASKLSRKDELARELDELIRLTKGSAK